MAIDGSWSVVLRGQFKVTVGMPASASEAQTSAQGAVGGLCSICVEVLPAGFQGSEVGRMLLPHISE